jgi:hypothetical protein
MARLESRSRLRGIVFIAIAFAFIGLAILFRTHDAIGIAVSLSGISLVGIWFITLPFTATRRASSRWFRQVAITCGIAAVLSASGHALLFLQPHRFDRIQHFELQTASQFLGGLWLGLLLSLFWSEELWDSRKRNVSPSNHET